jgi:hypothetical protein
LRKLQSARRRVDPKPPEGEVRVAPIKALTKAFGFPLDTDRLEEQDVGYERWLLGPPVDFSEAAAPFNWKNDASRPSLLSIRMPGRRSFMSCWTRSIVSVAAGEYRDASSGRL